MNVVLIFNKPKGFTSQYAVTKVKRILKCKKAGHAGSLDPIATGILLVCINEATKITPLLMELEKEYLFKAKFGISTDTYDADGNVTKVIENFELKKEEIEQILTKYKGEIMQTPPMYSAVKIDGTPLYRLARKGIEVERKPKKVIIHSIKIEEFKPPFVSFRVVCSKGTYVRALCNDIGEELGIGAHIVELERTRIGNFKVEESIDLEELKKIKEKAISDAFLTIDKALYFIPSVIIGDALVRKFLNGNSVKIPSGIVPAGWVKVKDKTGKILGIGFGNGVIIKPERIIWEEEL
ncbi:tRNA pseudouridine synthase B [Thermodesulfovibrio sp. N1]|uniref:tRNA pseudouridine(55) synthase TruB n=1 Tax=unclassified Thermodesulfovibrio TaxID=2645936 RepID=UPI00083AE2A3|nr:MULTISPECIES: tRNA pseudouridine(55) synthase TruB [unclassified Thermodesulfovibrio]MDI1471199.1 tRNA pseudouridine(55) synthase TruB [Thermodesulfovibrio sp. 1176]ODA44143.1 tRNA pseudouridine synthase B [Thermodesulfovibrio sp. N1]